MTWHVTTDTISETRTTYNVIADSPWGDPTAPSSSARTTTRSPRARDQRRRLRHRDGPRIRPAAGPSRPGAAQPRPLPVGRRRGGGLLGSDYYVDQLSDAEKRKIIAMLDFDMVASPNYARQVYDGDGSDLRPERRARRLRLHREPLQRLVRQPGSGARADPVRRPLGLRRLHQRRHPGRRHLHRRREGQDPGGAGHVRRHRRRAAGPLLPPGLRHHQQPRTSGVRAR